MARTSSKKAASSTRSKTAGSRQSSSTRNCK